MDNLLALLTALAGLVTALTAARNAAKQSDLQALRDTISALEAENTRLRACIEALGTDRDADRPEDILKWDTDDDGNGGDDGETLRRPGLRPHGHPRPGPPQRLCGALCTSGCVNRKGRAGSSPCRVYPTDFPLSQTG